MTIRRGGWLLQAGVALLVAVGACDGAVTIKELNATEKADMLRLHNAFRARYGAKPLVWDESLVTKAVGGDAVMQRCTPEAETHDSHYEIGQALLWHNYTQTTTDPDVQTSPNLEHAFEQRISSETSIRQVATRPTRPADETPWMSNSVQALWRRVSAVGCASCINTYDAMGESTAVFRCVYENAERFQGGYELNLGKDGDAIEWCKDVTCDVVAKTCEQVDSTDGSFCDNGQPNDVHDTCKSGECVQDWCVTLPDGAPCDDLLFHTLNDTCTGGLCAGIDRCVGVTCTPSSVCVTSICHGPSSQECLERPDPQIPDGTMCDDHDSATVDDVCTAGVCKGIDKCAGKVCTAASSPCKTSSCNPQTGLCEEVDVAEGTPCDDNKDATVEDKCTMDIHQQKMTCQGEDRCPSTCPPANACQFPGVCDKYTGICSHASKPDGTPCDDHLFYTDNDMCTAGECVGVDPCDLVTCTPSNSCRGSTCMLGGSCEEYNLPDTTPCDDQDSTTNNDMCTAGVCKGVATDKCAGKVCTASSPCKTSSCNPQTGLCEEVNKADATPCDDQDSTTNNDVCTAGVCKGSACSGPQCSTLQSLKASLSGGSTGGRMGSWTGDDHCSWAGVKCNGHGDVRDLDLSFEGGLNGTVPDLSGLGGMERLYVQGTGISGFGGLPPNLLELDFSQTQVKGPMPAAVLTLERVMTLRAKGAGLTGPLPVMPDTLRQLDVSQNTMDGPLPRLPAQMLTFIAQGNRFSGSLPECGSCLRLVLNNNELTGGMVVYPNLLMGHFHFNKLGGTYDAHTTTPKAYYVDLSVNDFEGPLPNFAGLPMDVFQGHHNRFTGPFHQATPGQRVMSKLIVSNNKLTGPHPTPQQADAVARIAYLFANTWD